MARRGHRILGGLAAVAVACAVVAPVAPASAGGALVPPQAGGSGGTEYGSAVAALGRPVAARFHVAPGRVVAGGRLPTIRLRLDEPGVPKVRARIVLRPRKGSGHIVRVVLGGVSTGRELRPAWPAGTVLAAGRYSVLVHATDPAGHALRRTGRSPGRTTLTVVAPAPKPAPKPVPAPLPVAVPAPPAPVLPSALGLGRFPVAGPHSYGQGFGVDRGDHVHQGVDVFGAQGLPIVAPLAGTVRFTDYQASAAGEYVVLHAASGPDLFFAHCVRGSTAVKVGQAVLAGQGLCSLGATGDASGPHLHFELWPAGWRTGAKDSVPVDPLAQLKAWDR